MEKRRFRKRLMISGWLLVRIFYVKSCFNLPARLIMMLKLNIVMLYKGATQQSLIAVLPPVPKAFLTYFLTRCV
jgi:hypothetical protein